MTGLLVCVCVYRERDSKATVIKCCHLGILRTWYMESLCATFAPSL